LPEDDLTASDPSSAASDEMERDGPEPSNSQRTVRFVFFGADGLRAGWSLLLFLLMVAGLFLSAQGLLRHGRNQRATSGAAVQRPEQSVTAAVRGDGVLFLIVGISSLAMSRIERRPLAAYGLGTTRGGVRQFVAGLLWGLIFLSLLVGVLRAGHLLVFDGRLLSGESVVRFGAEWAGGFLLVGLFEEYFLRGYLQFTLARGFSGVYGVISKSSHPDAVGFWTAAVLLSFVFGLGHGSNPGESSIGLLTAGAAGLVFAFSLWRTGSLWWAIGFHAAWDWAQSFLYGVADSGIMMQHHLFASHPVGRPILSGGLTGPEGSVLVLVVLGLAAGVIRVTLVRVRVPGRSETALLNGAAIPARRHVR